MSMPDGLRGALDLSGLVRRAETPPEAIAASAAAEESGIVFTADDQSFGSVVELSQTLPVIVEFSDERTGPTGVDVVVASYGGRLALARVDAMTNPQLAQAFRVTEVPTFAAVIGGRPLPLFSGLLAEAELRSLLDQVLQAAAQQGVAGTMTGEDGQPVEPAEAPLPPHHQEALDAIDRGDYAAAVQEYETAIAQNPRDELAVAGLAQVRLLQRLGADGAEPDEADQAFAAGDAARAFELLLDAWPAADQPERDRIRTRLLDYFEILGPEDERVGPARRRLTSLLY